MIAGITTLPLEDDIILPDYVQVFDAGQILIHPNYNLTTYDSDIALVSFCFLIMIAMLSKHFNLLLCKLPPYNVKLVCVIVKCKRRAGITSA